MRPSLTTLDWSGASDVIRDSLYDRIPLAGAPLATINTQAFLRLDGIQQLGFVSRVWPGARHTRLEHSLGVMHVARLAVLHLQRHHTIDAESCRTLVAAALLHDIGHYPFSHAIEELGAPIRSHEDVGSNTILDSELTWILRDQWGVDPSRVAAMIHGTVNDLAPDDRLLRSLLSGTLDVDKLDYLRRDARACNVPYGGVDTDRLISSLTIHESADRRSIAITEKGISPLHSLINARQEMFDNVYWHHTNRACMVMLLRAIQDALLAGAISADSLTNHDDASLLAFLQSDAMPRETRHLADNLAHRAIHKRAVEFSARAGDVYQQLSALWHDPGKRRSVELAMAEGLRERTGIDLPSTVVLIDIPKPEKWSTDVTVVMDRPPVGMHSPMTWREVVGLDDADLKRYEEHRRMIRIVAAGPYRETVAESWEELLLPALEG